MFLQIADSNQNKKRLEKLDKLTARMSGDSNLEIAVERVSHSFEELILIQNKVMEQAEKINLRDYLTYIDSEENQVVLIADQIDFKDTMLLKENFHNDIRIEIDKNINENFNNEPEATKSRKEDWNSLGAGIGIRIKDSEGSFNICSTAGIAQKGSKLWLMSAGHCNDKGDKIYQYTSSLGSTHLDATPSDFDFLLINVNNSNIDRLASNGLYSSYGNTSTGYDEALEGDFVEKTGLRVCKVGITTGRTCGEISRLGIRKGGSGLLDRGILITEVRKDGSLLSKGGDSGGAWFTQSKPYRLVGIHQGGNKNLPDKGSSVSYFTPWHLVKAKYGLTLYTSNTKKSNELTFDIYYITL